MPRVMPGGRMVRSLFAAAAEAAAAFAILFVILEGWRRDFRVPLLFSYDALEYLMQVKGTIDNGWWWVHPRLSAPGVFRQVDYPSNTTVDQAIVWLVQLFTSEPGLVINVSWMIMVVLSALIASRCLRLVGVTTRVAIPLGLLFALSPYALSRHIDHLSLAIYLVPVPCTVALLIATGRLHRLSAAVRGALLAGCGLVGFNYPYYAFFACFVILVASVIGAAVESRRRELAQGLAFTGVICLATAINLTPSFYSWAVNGKPLAIPSKAAAEAEQYGLKIRQLVSPALDHSFPLFEQWTRLETDAGYPFETENRDARLGVIGTVGFLALLCGVFVPRMSAGMADPRLFADAGRLTLALLLLATVGGFGSLFNLLVSPEIRAYNRVVPFISLFSLVAIGLLSQALLARRQALWAPALLGALAIGLLDQAQAARSLNSTQQDIREEWIGVGSLVGSLEERLPANAMVFQLPVLTYLTETGRERMLPMDHLKPYMVSRRLHWSFPALDDSIVRWHQRVGRLPPPLLAAALDTEGFTAILIDRNGYADRAQALLSDLGAGRSPEAVIAANQRYVAIDLRRLPRALAAARLPRVGAPPASATAGVPDCGVITPHNLEWIAATSAPFSETPVVVDASGPFSVIGWAVDQRRHGTAGDVDVLIDDRAFPAVYGLERPDVAGYLGGAAYAASGFSVRLTGADLGTGPRAVSIRILAADRTCYYQGPSITVLGR